MAIDELDLPPPRLFAPADVVEGYQILERLERRATLEALHQNREAVALWYRALTLYRRALPGVRDFSDLGDSDPRRTARQLQSQLLGLGISSAKAALDMLLTGYYSIAFAAIRHMLESFAQILFVDANPAQARRWYAGEAGGAEQPDPPSMKIMVQDIKAYRELQTMNGRNLFDWLYHSWRLMSKGAHPSGAGIRQTESDRDDFFVFGATYHPELCLLGFDHGLFAVAALLPLALNSERTQDEAWNAEWTRLRRDVSAWREARTAEVEAAEGELPPDPPEAPGPTTEDVNRARRTISAWDANANSWKGPLPGATPERQSRRV